MKLNPDCIREILFAVESQTGYHKATCFSKVIQSCSFPIETVLYHINQCEMSGFFTRVEHLHGVPINMPVLDNGCYDLRIYDLSPKGHEFLANIRSDNIWSKTKNAASKIGSFALPALQQIASNLIETAIKTHFGL